jgi:hypothetical protein
MIVQTTLTKNECFLIKEMLPLWAKYADGFIFYDDASDDDTVEFLKQNKEKYNILAILQSKDINAEDGVVVETDIRGMLFNEAKKYTNYITCLDTDEYFDGPGNKQDLHNILESHPDYLLCFKWVQYTSKDKVRVDGPWRENYKDRAGLFLKDGTMFSRTLRHSLHLPLPPNGSLNVSSKKIFVAHCQWIDKRWVGVKQYYWKVRDYLDRVKHGEHTYEPSAYDASVNNFAWEYEQAEYALKIDEKIYSKQDMKKNDRLCFVKNNTQKYNIPNLGDWNMGIYSYATKDMAVPQSEETPMYFCTAGDEIHFNALINLIGSIHKHNYAETKEIAVFNLGLNAEQVNTLNRLQKVKVYDVERANPLITEPLYNSPNRWIRGLFSWKPVVIKQALQMFPYVLYADAGTTFEKPVNDLFKHITQHKYFISDCGHSIKWMTTKFVIDKFELSSEQNKWLMSDEVFGIDAGFMGLSKEMESIFIDPVYELSKDIHNFIDDGTCPDGWGTGRHDQTLFSIQARKLKLNILNHDRDVEECFLNVNDKKIPFHITHSGERVKPNTVVFRCRRNVPPHIFNENTRFLKLR